MNLMLEFSCGEGILASIVCAIEATQRMMRDFGSTVIVAGYRNEDCRLVQEFLGDGRVNISLQVCRRSCFEVRLEIGDPTLRNGVIDAPVAVTSRIIEHPPVRGVAVESEFRIADLECETMAREGVGVETEGRAAV